MITENNLPSRQSMRKTEFNYASPEYYFVTICCKNKQSLFGNIFNNKMILNLFGNIAMETWQTIINKYVHLTIYAIQIMPNHLHVIIKLHHEIIENNNNQAADFKQKIVTLSTIIGSYKSMVSNACLKKIDLNNLTHEQKFLSENGTIWQRNFYDTIIRDDISLKEIERYIHENPLRWQERLNQQNKSL